MGMRKFLLYKGGKKAISESKDLSAFKTRVSELNFGDNEVSELCVIELSRYLDKRCSHNYGCYELKDSVIEKLESDYFDRSLFQEAIAEELKLILRKIGSAVRYVNDWKQDRVYICFR